VDVFQRIPTTRAALIPVAEQARPRPSQLQLRHPAGAQVTGGGGCRRDGKSVRLTVPACAGHNLHFQSGECERLTHPRPGNAISANPGQTVSGKVQSSRCVDVTRGGGPTKARRNACQDGEFEVEAGGAEHLGRFGQFPFVVRISGLDYRCRSQMLISPDQWNLSEPPQSGPAGFNLDHRLCRHRRAFVARRHVDVHPTVKLWTLPETVCPGFAEIALPGRRV